MSRSVMSNGEDWGRCDSSARSGVYSKGEWGIGTSLGNERGSDVWSRCGESVGKRCGDTARYVGSVQSGAGARGFVGKIRHGLCGPVTCRCVIR